MNGVALSLVLVAAVLHAVWNFAGKCVEGGGARFVFLYCCASAAVFGPAAVILLVLEPERPQWTWLLAALVTAVLHVAYGIVLQRGYAVGDLSVVYPLARGTDRRRHRGSHPLGRAFGDHARRPVAGRRSATCSCSSRCGSLR
ncbi:MAG: EamA family transporter [Amycolatopsis sp.]|nr:EamA family transporter [Amycolatopsis sp.]